MVGERVLHFNIEEKLGEGGMGIVYLAKDTKLMREVAIKFLPQSITFNEEAHERFKLEAQTAASLNHPNITTIYSIEETNGQIFIVMEYIEGVELKEKINKGPLSKDEAVNIAIQIAEGLAAAHKKGIIHRDLKSSNIMVTSDGNIKIMDFGLAKIRNYSQLTKIGTIAGTISYMAPEQARGEEVDQRTDIWSFGVVLYEILTGHLPFRGDYEQAVIYSILNEEPIFSRDIDARFRELLLKMMAKKQEERFENLTQVIEKLIAIRSSVPEKDKRSSPSIAVLPFSDLSSAHDQEFFCEGIAEEILNTFSKIHGIRVSSRTSSFQFKNKNFDIREIGQKLKVDSILEGSVRKSGDRLRINIQLINIEDGFQLWSDRYDRRVEDIFELQDDIAGNVVSALKGILTVDEKEKIRSPETNIEAYELFLKGRHYFTQLNLSRAEAVLEEAIKIDPLYTPALAELAKVFSWRYEWFGHKDTDLIQAERYSKKALELAENLAETHIARAFVLTLAKNFRDAENEFLNALRIDPNSYDAHYLFARMNFSMGDFKRAEEHFYKASEIHKDDFQSISLLSMVYRILGEEEKYINANSEAIIRAEKQLELNPANDRALSLGAINLLNAGQIEKAFTWQEKVLKLYPEEPSVLVNAACFYARAGFPSKSLDLIEHFVDKGFGNRSWIEHDPDYDSIRDEPRFRLLLERLK